MKSFHVGLLCTLFFICGSIDAEDFESGITKLSDNLAIGISKTDTKKVSVIDFTDLQGRGLELGRFVAEEISVALVNSGKGFSVMDRANMKNLLDEHKLTATGLVNPDRARELKGFSGVDAIVLGNVTPFGDSIVITAKAISTETTQVLAAVKISVPKNKEITAMLTPETLGVTTVQTESVKPPPLPPKPSKDFQAPNSVFNIEIVSIELMSFKRSGNGYIAMFQATNRHKDHHAHIGLNVHPNNVTGAVVMNEENGDTMPLGNVGGISYSSSIYGNQADSYQGTKNFCVMAAREGNVYGAVRQLNEELSRFTEIEPGQSVVFTLQFINRSYAQSSLFRLMAEIVIIDVAGEGQARATLRNVVIPSIKL